MNTKGRPNRRKVHGSVFGAHGAPVLKIDDRLVMIGDNIKIVKEAKKMPGVKKLHLPKLLFLTQ
jgi:hypothetical protein